MIIFGVSNRVLHPVRKKGEKHCIMRITPSRPLAAKIAINSGYRQWIRSHTAWSWLEGCDYYDEPGLACTYLINVSGLLKFLLITHVDYSFWDDTSNTTSRTASTCILNWSSLTKLRQPSIQVQLDTLWSYLSHKSRRRIHKIRLTP